MTVYFYRNISS